MPTRKAPVHSSPDDLKSALKRYKHLQRKKSINKYYEDVDNELEDTDSIEDDKIVSSSPLLTSTPNAVSKQLLKLYPYLILVDKFLSILTWNYDTKYNEKPWLNYVLLVLFVITVKYFQFIAQYLGHLIIIGLIWTYSQLDNYVNEMVTSYPTLDDIVHIMNNISKKADLLQRPITILNKDDIKKLFFTTLFFSPIYIIIIKIFFSSQDLLLLFGCYILTYYSPTVKKIRQTLWSVKFIKLMAYYFTGLNFGGLMRRNTVAFAKATEIVTQSIPNFKIVNKEIIKPIKYTFVLYENQRKWIGIGWTASMLSYERDPWTDEYLNTTSGPWKFKLPNNESDLNKWRWVDNNWSLDLTNNNLIPIAPDDNDDNNNNNNNKNTLVTNPGEDEGYVYYDNTWNNPSVEDSFSKFTRRRRWVRTAEFICNKDFVQENTSGDKFTSIQSNNENKKMDHDDPLYIENDTLIPRKVSFSGTDKVHIIPTNSY